MVVDQEMTGGGGADAAGEGRRSGEDGAVKRPRGDVACIPFGALTKFEEWADGKRRKLVLERGWVVSRVGAQKRAAEDRVEEEVRKRVILNPKASQAQLDRIRGFDGR